MTGARFVAVAVALGPWLALAQTQVAPQRDAPPRTRVLRSWDDTIKRDGRDVARHVNIVFDYRAGEAWEHAFDQSGRPLSSRRLTSNLPRPTLEEIAEAIAIVRADPVVGRVVQRTNARPEGGFLLEEEGSRACGVRTRCIQLLLMAEGSMGLLRRTVVDLVRRGVVYQSYVPKDLP